ncbi:MAG: response regulator [Defluviitaleaceae bacterium]|nr:response regulator [Defluviitaleaceae bacterium]
MRHLLVIDDEPNLVDGLCNAIAESLGDSVDVSKAYSGSEALAILSESPMDLVITDIRMPGINGLDLLHAIHECQFGCRVLIITGYEEFNVIHEAVKLPSTAGFLLKDEGDEAIIKAVNNTLLAIEEDEKIQLSLALADRQSKALEILLRERRLWHLLGILPYYDESSSLETTLAVDVAQPMLLIVVRTLSAYFSTDTLIWLEQQVHKSFSAIFSMEMSILSPTDTAWLLQKRGDTSFPLEDDGRRAGVLRTGMLEIQSLLANNGVEVSVALASKWIKAPNLPGYVHALRKLMQNLLVGGRHQQVIDVSADEEGQFAASLESANFHVSGERCIHRAKNALLEGDEKDWEDSLMEASRISDSDPSIITRLLTMLIASVDALGLPMIEDIPILLNPANDYENLREIGAMLCLRRRQASKHAIRDLITRIHETIEKELGSPTLSLAFIAAQTHHNPSYLSRLYKQHTGVNITETINSMRISRACELLNDSSLRINDISRRVGYASPSYFTFCFCKKMGVTPKEYRSGISE